MRRVGVELEGAAMRGGKRGWWWGMNGCGAVRKLETLKGQLFHITLHNTILSKLRYKDP